MENKLTSWWNTHRPTKRRLIQLYSALLYNANLKGFVNGEIYTGKTKALCVPGFNCYSCPGATGACPLGSLQASLAASDKQIGFYIIGIFLLYGLIAGRTICGWACPMGLIQELLYKIPTPKIKKSRITRALSYLKYIFLAVFVVAVTLWYGLAHDMAVPGFCKYICPAGTFEGAMGLLSNPNNKKYFGMLGILFTRKFIIMLVLGALCIFCYRAFCRFICPLGAIYGMFNQLALIGVKVDMDRCNGCGHCVRNCKMDVRRVGDHECIHCGQCMSGCAQGAISIKAGNFTLAVKDDGKDKQDTGLKTDALKRRKIEKYAWTAALVILAFALLWYNVIDNKGYKNGRKEAAAETDNVSALTGNENGTPKDDVSDKTDIETESVIPAPESFSQRYSSEAPIGHNVGEQLEDFTAACVDGSTFRLSDQKGKVVVINLWATWCGPCVQELPHFYDFYHEHGDDAAVLTCHSRYGEHDDVYEDVRGFLKDKLWDTPVTVDDDDNGIFEKTGGSATLPQTIVLNRKGEVIYNEVRSVTPEILEKLYEKAAMGEAPGEYKKYLNDVQVSDENTLQKEETEDSNNQVNETEVTDNTKDETEEEAEDLVDEINALEDETEDETAGKDSIISEDESTDEDEPDVGSETSKDTPIIDVPDSGNDTADEANAQISADVRYDFKNNRITVSGDYVKSFIDKTGIKTKEEFLKYLKKHFKK